MAQLNAPTAAVNRLIMRNVHKSFGATRALDGVNFSVVAGEIHALVGENGAGKSTLMKILAGAISPDRGEIFLDGQQFNPSNPLQARQQGVVMIYQELSLAPHLTVEENITLGVEPHRWRILDRKQMREWAINALQRLGHPEIRPEQPVRNLTLAEQQLVEIGRALAVGCRVLVLDEPTSSLSYQDIQKLFSILRILKEQGQAIIYISHFLEEVKEISDRCTVLRDGKTVGTQITPELPVNQIIEMMVGRNINQLYKKSRHQAKEPLLRIKNLSGARKPVRAEFDLYRGEVLGIAGLVGAGRTELLRCLFGLEPIKTGEIKLGGFIGPASPAQRWLQKTGMLSEDRGNEGLALSLNLADNLTLTSLKKLGPFGLVLPRTQRKLSQEWIEKLDIRCRDVSQKAGELSGGNQQKLALARLLFHEVDILLLDEPTRGIDVASKAQIYELIDQLVCQDQESGRLARAVLIVSSYLPELLGICDRIAVMYRGVLGPARPASQFTEHELMMEAMNPVMQT